MRSIELQIEFSKGWAEFFRASSAAAQEISVNYKKIMHTAKNIKP